jgi:hypothetical protein
MSLLINYPRKIGGIKTARPVPSPIFFDMLQMGEDRERGADGDREKIHYTL